MPDRAVKDIPTLLAWIEAGGQPKYLFFWGHRARNNRPARQCFSQWWPSPFTVDNVLYHSAEHFMMAEKARLFKDEETRGRILRAPNPGAAKQFGREVRGFDEKTWRAERFRVVVRGNCEKFGQNEDLRAFLVNTKGRVLVEASPVDTIWGIGLAEDDPRAQHPEQWTGLNLLGFALMEVRRGLLERNPRN